MREFFFLHELLVFVCFSCEGRLRLGTEVLSQCPPDIPRVPLSQRRGYDSEEFEGAQCGLVGVSGSDSDGGAAPESRSRGGGFSQHASGGGEETSTKTTKSATTRKGNGGRYQSNVRQEFKKIWGKSNRRRNPRKCERLCPVCERPWDGRKRHRVSVSDVSSDEMVCLYCQLYFKFLCCFRLRNERPSLLVFVCKNFVMAEQLLLDLLQRSNAWLFFILSWFSG